MAPEKLKGVVSPLSAYQPTKALPVLVGAPGWPALPP